MPVRLIEFDETRRYSPEDFERFLIDVALTRRNGWRPPVLPPDLPRVDVETLRVSPWTRHLIREGREADPDFFPSRSEAAWRVMQDLIRAGCDDATVAAIFLDPAHPIGQKAREKGRDWLSGDIGRARAEVEAEARLVFPRRAPRRPTLSTEVLTCR